MLVASFARLFLEPLQLPGDLVDRLIDARVEIGRALLGRNPDVLAGDDRFTHLALGVHGEDDVSVLQLGAVLLDVRKTPRNVLLERFGDRHVPAGDVQVHTGWARYCRLLLDGRINNCSRYLAIVRRAM